MTSQGNDEANARLIAAAPDLLAACEEALAMMDRVREVMGDYIHEREAYDLGVTLEAAIRKAGGGEGTVP